MTIDETTRPPWRWDVHVEAAVRRLPGWGRVAIPALGVGIAGAAVVMAVASALLGLSLSDDGLVVIPATCLVSAVTALVAGRGVRRYPFASAFVFGGLLVLCVQAYAERWFGAKIPASVGLLVCATLTASSLVEGAARRLAVAAESTVRATVLRSVLTSVCLLVLAYLLRFAFPSLHLRAEEVPVIALFGLFVTAPPLEVSKAALLHRLKAEAARDEEA